MSSTRHIYVVRTWREPGEAGGVWRASLRDGATSESRHFASAEALAHFLLDPFAGEAARQTQSPGPAEAG